MELMSDVHLEVHFVFIHLGLIKGSVQDKMV